MLTNTFHFKVLETYLPSITKHSRSLIKNLITVSENGNKPIPDIESYITLCALDVVGGEYYVFLFSSNRSSFRSVNRYTRRNTAKLRLRFFRNYKKKH